jgi:hypothetical protein
MLLPQALAETGLSAGLAEIGLETALFDQRPRLKFEDYRI